MKYKAFSMAALLFTLASTPVQAHTGVFQLPAFVEQGLFSLGVNPEVNLSPNRTGLGVNFMYTHGVAELINVSGILGTGSGEKLFRIGSSVSFDFFPDVGKQPGIGVGAQIMYYNMATQGFEVEVGGTPYIHKSFELEGMVLDPFLGFPLAVVFSEGDPQFRTGFSFGSHFEVTPHLRIPLELGMSIHQGETYASTGMLYHY